MGAGRAMGNQLESGKWGGKTCPILGGGERTIESALQNQFWRPQKVGLVWSVAVSSKENDRARTNGGGKRSMGGGGGLFFSDSPFLMPLPNVC